MRCFYFTLWNWCRTDSRTFAKPILNFFRSLMRSYRLTKMTVLENIMVINVGHTYLGQYKISTWSLYLLRCYNQVRLVWLLDWVGFGLFRCECWIGANWRQARKGTVVIIENLYYRARIRHLSRETKILNFRMSHYYDSDLDLLFLFTTRPTVERKKYKHPESNKQGCQEIFIGLPGIIL